MLNFIYFKSMSDSEKKETADVQMEKEKKRFINKMKISLKVLIAI